MYYNISNTMISQIAVLYKNNERVSECVYIPQIRRLFSANFLNIIIVQGLICLRIQSYLYNEYVWTKGLPISPYIVRVTGLKNVRLNKVLVQKERRESETYETLSSVKMTNVRKLTVFSRLNNVMRKLRSTSFRSNNNIRLFSLLLIYCVEHFD